MIDAAPDIHDYRDVLKAKTHVGTRSPFHFLDGDSLAIEMEFGEMLMDAIAKDKPKVIVEIGTGSGYSTAWMALGTQLAGQGAIYTYDHTARLPYWWDQTIGAIDGIIIHLGDFTFNRLDFKKPIDFVFHDSQHRIELITPDLDRLIPLMSNTGQIWIHDATPELSRALQDYFDSKGDWDYYDIPVSCGMGIAKKQVKEKGNG